MKTYLFPIRLLLCFVSFLCLILSYMGLSYLNLGWYLIIVFVFLAEVMFTMYDIFTKRDIVLNDFVYNVLGIGLFLYVLILYMRLFFDTGMLYIVGDLIQRFTFINHHLPMLAIGIIDYFVYHICIELDKYEKSKQRKKR